MERLLHINVNVGGLEVIARKTEWTVQKSIIQNSNKSFETVTK
jgi:hypothetical protein